MNRKEAAELLPIIKAYAEGKEIEIFDKTTKMWKTAMLPHFDCDSKNYRIKPEQKYRLWVGSHFTMTEDKKKSTRLATNEERLMLFEKMFKYGIALNKQEHHLIGKLW